MVTVKAGVVSTGDPASMFEYLYIRQENNFRKMILAFEHGRRVLPVMVDVMTEVMDVVVWRVVVVWGLQMVVVGNTTIAR